MQNFKGAASKTHKSHDKSERLSHERVESQPNAAHMNNLPEKSLRFHTDLILNALYNFYSVIHYGRTF